MPDFEVTGPDGAKYQLTAPDEAAAMAAFRSYSGKGDVSRETPVGMNDVVRSAAQGVPVVGSPGLLNRANAAINATVAPAIEPLLAKGDETLDQPTWGERYERSLELQNKRDAKFAKEHPIVDTTAKIAGGIAGTAPLVMAAPAAMGAAGTLPQMITRGAASGAALGAADAAARGEDVAEGGGIGAVTGAAGGPIGRGIGRAVERVRGRPAGAPALAPREVIDVAGEKIPVPPQDVDQARTIEALRKGEPSAGRDVVEQFDREAQDAVQRATNTIAGDMTGLPPNARPAGRATPEEAAQAVQQHLAAQEAARATGENATGALAQLEGDLVRGRLGGGSRVNSPFEAAEGIGGGVARERTAARAQTRSLYDQAGEVPGTFDESVIRTLPDEIRSRLASGPEGLQVDPETTPFANQALKVLDQDAPEGIFRNMAVRRPAPGGSPVTGAPPASVSDAEAAYQQLRQQGVPDERARAAVANVPGSENLPGSTLSPHTVATAAGGAVDVKPRVVEASALRTSADAGYDQALQPRNRMRAASDMQINDMAKNLTPHRLGASAEADRGAPIIGPDHMVESGNGRVLALRQVYREGGPKAQQYRQWLESQGADTAGMREPVLVRERTTPMSMEERKAFTVAANQSSTLSLSGSERALADSRALSPDTLGLIRNPADLGAVENRDFVRQFMATVPASERGALMTANGDLSSEGLSRVRNAVMAKAYGNTSILARAAESTKDEIKSISSGLQAAAPEWAQLRAAVDAGAVPKELDATAHLLDAVERTAKIRGRGTSLAEGLAQTDAFAAQSPESEAFMRLFYSADGKSAASASQVSNALRDYAQQAGKVDASPGLGLGLEPVTSRDILANTSKKVGAPAQLAQEVKDAALAPVEAATAKEPIPEVDLGRMDSARKRLVVMYGDARKAAMGPGGSGADVRAMGRVLNEFDQVIIDAFENGRFSGDSETARSLIEQARASHALYRQTFTARGGSDPIGRDVEKILGRYADTATTPADTLQMTFGPQNNPGGGRQAQLGQRLRQIVGEHSPEWGAAKRSLLTYVEGEGSPAERAGRIEQFLHGENGRGRVLAQVYWSPEERAAVANYARNLRAAEPVRLNDLRGIDKVMAKITGQLDGIPASDREIVTLLAGGSRDAGQKGLSVELARVLKRDMNPEAFVKIKQGLLSHVVEKPAGVKEWTDAAIADNLAKFVKSPVALLVYSKDELSAMRDLGRAHRAHAPVPGATNPSGTGPMLKKLLGGMKTFALPALGAATHGPLGIVTGMAATKAAGGVAEARAARGARDLLYQRQARLPVDPRFARAGPILSRGTQAGRH